MQLFLKFFLNDFDVSNLFIYFIYKLTTMPNGDETKVSAGRTDFDFKKS